MNSDIQRKSSRGKALIAMSGGVDSAVAALLTVKSGYSAIGATMYLKEYTSKDEYTLSEDIRDARLICDTLGISHEILQYGKEFREEVISSFVNSYINGETPNPCIICNRRLKFGRLLEHTLEIGAETIVTGHYANVSKDSNGRFLLERASDPQKDQSYVLWTLSQDVLSHVYFPLGQLTKSQVREIAAAHGFKNASKKDSQDICFIPDGDYVSYIEGFCGRSFPSGNFVDINGNILGRHQGIIRYTPGQRKGLGTAFGKVMYVNSKDSVSNTVILSSNHDLFSKRLLMNGINLISTDNITTPIKAYVKIRYNHVPCPATVIQTEADMIEVIFDTPQRAVAKGQSAVIYDGDTVIGGGFIC